MQHLLFSYERFSWLLGDKNGILLLFRWSYCTPLHLAQSINCIPAYTLLPNRIPTVKAIATAGIFFANGDDSTTRSSPLMIWYRVFEDNARKTPANLGVRKHI